LNGIGFDKFQTYILSLWGIVQPHVTVLADKLKHRLLAAQAQTGKARSQERKQA
jgi:hypothetical protein